MALFALLLISVWMVSGTYGQTSEISGTYNYTTYQVGGALSQIVISAPHGGTLTPTEIPNRPNGGCYDSVLKKCIYTTSCGLPDPSKCDTDTIADLNTQLLAVELADAIKMKFGGVDSVRPHVIINELHRSKMDANREVNEATFGNSIATIAYNDFHGFINNASTAATTGGRNALYIDLHGQNEPEGWNMVGVLLSKSKLTSTTISETWASITSLNQIHTVSGQTMEELVRGSTSIGGILQAGGYDTVPSPVNRNAGSGYYYSGGYNLKTYGTRPGIGGFQIEVHRSLRVASATRKEFAAKLADAVHYWMTNYY